MISLKLVSSFSILMQEYRPPVKSSVKKLYSDRSSVRQAESSTASNRHHRMDKTIEKKRQQPQPQDGRRFSTSSKSSHASSYAIPLPTAESHTSISRGVQSFERRMREMVLGTQQKQKYNQQQQQQTSVSKVSRRPYQKILETDDVTSHGVGAPVNIRVVQCLQEYKDVVGNEAEKLCVVRFYANYCKVRQHLRCNCFYYI